jgi:hypothetical protein
VWESLVKFHISYVGPFFLGCVVPHQTAIEKAFSFALRWVQLPVGMLIYLLPESLAGPLANVSSAAQSTAHTMQGSMA